MKLTSSTWITNEESTALRWGWTSSKWLMLKVRLFGKKHVGTDGTMKVTGYFYKDRIYITDTDYRFP